MRRYPVGLLFFLLLFAAPSLVFAQPSVGARAGVSGNPDQFFFGMHFESREIADGVTARPNFELGLGDNTSLFALNFEFVWSMPLRRQPWRLYFGGGPAANIYSHAVPVPTIPPGGRFDGPSGVEPGFNVLGGIQHRRGFFGELKLGAIDSPAVKLTVGYVFKRR